MPTRPRKTAVERELEDQIEDLNRVATEVASHIDLMKMRHGENRRFADSLRRRLSTLRNARAPK